MAKKQQTKNSQLQTLIEKLRENSTSIIIVLIIIFLGGVLLKTISGGKKITINEDKKTETEQLEISEASTSYKVKEGDNLWKIAESKYGSGYNFVDIAEANKIKNTDLIFVGQTLSFPDVKKRSPTVGEIVTTMTSSITITADQYKVQRGDYLWKIAIAAYGDGYQWPKIAKENKIPNPDIIYPDHLLKLPR